MLMTTNIKESSRAKLRLDQYDIITYLNILLNSNKGLLECVKAGGVQHLLLNLSGVWAPGHEEELLLLRGLKCNIIVMQ
jgi:hypothetical protein